MRLMRIVAGQEEVKEFLEKGGLDNVLNLLKDGNALQALKIMAKSASTILVSSHHIISIQQEQHQHQQLQHQQLRHQQLRHLSGCRPHKQLSRIEKLFKLSKRCCWTKIRSSVTRRAKFCAY